MQLKTPCCPGNFPVLHPFNFPFQSVVNASTFGVNHFFTNQISYMRVLLSCMLPAALFVAGCTARSGTTGTAGTTADSSNYFYLSGRKVLFTEIKDKLAVRVKSKNVYNEMLKSGTGSMKIDTSYRFIGDVAILQKTQAILETRDTSSSIVPPTSDDLGSIIQTNDTKARFVLTDRVVAKFRSDITDRQIDSIVAGMGCSILEKSTARRGRVILQCNVSSTLRNANKLFESRLVEYSHPDFIAEVELRSPPFYPNDRLFIDQWHLNNTGQGGGTVNADINAPEAWDITRGMANVRIAIIDDAIDVTHEDLAANLVAQRDITAQPDDNNAAPDDIFSERHGTSVAGVAVAKGNNNLGVSGSCPDCSLIAIRALSNRIADHASAFDYAVTAGAWIISNSWGYAIGTPATDDLLDAIDNAARNGRNGRGCVIFFAMSNDPIDDCSGPTPDISSLPNVIAISQSTNQDLLGSGGRGRCMDLIAPTRGGTLGITTTDITAGGGYSATNYYADFGGTSSATPLVAGVAGLMLSVNPNLTRAQVQTILQNTADKIDAANANYQNGFSVTHGYGRVNALAAVAASRQ